MGDPALPRNPPLALPMPIALRRLADKERMELVAMDMWRAYKQAVHAVLPYTTIVIDKFHVLRLTNAAWRRSAKSTAAA
jgi:transposase